MMSEHILVSMVKKLELDLRDRQCFNINYDSHLLY